MAPKRKPDRITYGKQQAQGRPKRRRQTSFLDLPAEEINMSFVPAKHTPTPLVPKRPDSQKAASMAVEPSPEDVQQVMNVTGTEDYAHAARFLRAKQNNVDAAVGAMFDGEDISKLESATSWDESAWGAGKEGAGGNGNLHPLGASAAPTRGPSPAPSLGISNPKTKHDEDADLAAALAASQQDIRMTSFQQETGVVGQDGTESKYFGPATRKEYSETQWGMVLSNTTQEIVPDVPLRDTVNTTVEVGGAPAIAPRLLKHLPDGDYTPNLLMICNAIPKAREAFLMRDHVRVDYGYDSDWWRGHTIAMPRIVHTADGSAADPDSDKYDELIAESQRLMAFLDHSDRIYATIGGLTQTDLVKNNALATNRSGSLLELFLQSWTRAATSTLDNMDQQVSGLFTTTVGTNASEGMATPDMTVMDMDINTQEDQRTDLFELMDNLLWDTEPESTDHPDNYIERPAEILVMRLSQKNTSATSTGVDVPATFHLDKYLRENVPSTKSVRQQMAQGRKRVAKIEEIERKLTKWQHPTKTTQLEAKQLLGHTLGHFSGQNRRNADVADKTNNASLANYDPSNYADVAAKLEQVVASIDKKLELLAEEKRKTQKAVSHMSKAPPPGLPEAEQKHRYTLRGVATKPNVTYVLRMTEEEEQDMTVRQEDDATPEGFQWWRLEYHVSGNSARILRSKAVDYEVVRAVDLENSSALLVYADDNAADLSYYDQDLPLPLKQFVERDSQAFREELERAPPTYGTVPASGQQQQGYAFDIHSPDVPRPSIERESGRASMDSTRAEGGYSPVRTSEEHEFMETDEHAAQHSEYGLGYDSKPRDPEVVDIHLPPEDTLGPMGSKDVEMVEKAHRPLVPRPGAGPPRDTTMSGMEGQDMGVGGAAHVEDAEMN